MEVFLRLTRMTLIPETSHCLKHFKVYEVNHGLKLSTEPTLVRMRHRRFLEHHGRETCDFCEGSASVPDVPLSRHRAGQRGGNK